MLSFLLLLLLADLVVSHCEIATGVRREMGRPEAMEFDGECSRATKALPACDDLNSKKMRWQKSMLGQEKHRYLPHANNPQLCDMDDTYYYCQYGNMPVSIDTRTWQQRMH